jgi:hypothetical protein
MARYPVYEVLFLRADRELGWKLAPNERWPWTGHFWYAADFHVDVVNNAEGFRDRDHEVANPDGKVRVAFLGDSFMEAVQVPIEMTIPSQVERELNAGDPSTKYETFNFGVSAYGIGQYPLVWENYVRKYAPRKVFILVAKFLFDRTVNKEVAGVLPAGNGGPTALWVRPTYRFENGELVRVPARDYEKLVEAQNEINKTRFDGKWWKKKNQSLVLFLGGKGDILRQRVFARLRERFAASAPASGPAEPALSDEDIIALNLKIIEEMGKSVRESGGQLVILDVSQYFFRYFPPFQYQHEFSERLAGFAKAHGFGYVSASEGLIRSNENGVPTQWKTDRHFNAVANKIVADRVSQWLKEPE